MNFWNQGCVGPLQGEECRRTCARGRPDVTGRWRESGWGSGGFTLLEVLVSVAIAVGLLMVALHYHQQTTRLRSELLGEADRMAAIRLILDRMTTELRGAVRRDGEHFVGGATMLEFTTTEAVGQVGYRPGDVTPRLGGGVGSRRVSYGLVVEVAGTNRTVLGLHRSEVNRGVRDGPVPSEVGSVPPGGTDTLAAAHAPPVLPEPVTDGIRSLRFRYFDGSNWREGWDSAVLPRGIEVTLGAEADSEEPGMQGEIVRGRFQRVVVLPASRPMDMVGLPPVGSDPAGVPGGGVP